MKKKVLFPVLLAAMAFPLVLHQNPIRVSADFIGEINVKNDYLAHGVEVNGRIADEGFVLLKNDGFLPMKGNESVSLAGKASTNLAKGGGGSGDASVSSGVTEVTLPASLREVGFEVNPTTEAFYKDRNKSGSGRTNGNSNWSGVSQVTIGETPLESYGDAELESFDEYSDAIIQVLTREGSEGCDVKTCDCRDNNSAPFSYKHALELSDNEEALFEEIKTHTNHVIIVINSSNIFECERFENDPKVSAILWVGNVGDVGAGAIGRILCGEVNPSGRTVDTWGRDFTKDPTFQNFSDNAQTNLTTDAQGNPKYAAQDTMFNSDGTPVRSYGTDKNYTDTSKPRWDDEKNLVVKGGLNGVKPSAYVSYEEGIYVDYRYYETRYADMARENKSAADQWYQSEEGVLYPFGYGLSYTTFDQKIIRVAPAKGATLEDDDVINVSVKVTNTGKVTGKDAIQLYWRAPYTAGGIEKADHVLCAFDKTHDIEPGQSEIMQLTFHLQDVANYDCFDKNDNNFKGYELDGGEYELMLMKNAHDPYGYVKYNIAEGGIQYENDRFTGYKVENRFTDNGFYSSMPGEDDIEFEQMSRADFEGTFPHHPTVESRTLGGNSRVEEFLTHRFSIAEYEEGNNEYIPATARKTEQDFVTNGWEQKKVNSRTQLSAMKDLAWDDPKWEEFINEFTWDEMLNFTERNGMSSPSQSNIGKSGFTEGDGPQKLKSANGIYWVSSPIIAATYNPRLAHEQGECVGMEANLSNASGWWGPAVNTHRSPFGGRNFEYYAADPFLMGRMAANVVGAATDRGIFCYFKHFAVNDQERNRESGISFLTEQALREIYLKSFQMVFEEGKSIGVMGSYNRMGLLETAANYNLLTEVLRNEWGFQGAVLSDMTHSGNGSVDNKCYENVNTRVLAGCNSQLDSGGFSGHSEAKWDSSAWNGKGAPTYTGSNGKAISWSYWYATRQMTKGVMYMSINCKGGNTNNYTLVADDGVKELSFTVGEAMSYNVSLSGASEYRLNQRIVLPDGVTFSNGTLAGTFENVGLYRVDVIATVGSKRSAIKLLINIVPNESDYDESLMEKYPDPTPAKKKKGCFGDIASTAAIIGLVTLAGVGFALLAIERKKRASN